MVRPWQKLAETARKVFEHYNFEVWTVKFRNPTTEKESEFVLHGQKNKTGAAVLAVTVNLNVVAIREYMQGADMIIRLLPGGAAAFEGEAPEETARRELMEETGYQAEELIPLGYCFLEPRNSWTISFLFLARDCEKKEEPKHDPSEEVEVELISLDRWIVMAKKELVEPAAVSATFRALSYLGID